MRILYFTPPNDEKIIIGSKTLTARCWKQKPPEIGEIVRAQTGYAKATTFAHLRVTDVWKWDGTIHYGGTDTPRMTVMAIAEKEGYPSWNAFITAYHDMNGKKIFDTDRTHYFIEFRLTTLNVAELERLQTRKKEILNGRQEKLETHGAHTAMESQHQKS